MLKLTDEGERQATKVDMKQDLENKVLTYMYMCGKSVELEEVQDYARLSDEKTTQLVQRMINEGFVEEI